MARVVHSLKMAAGQDDDLLRVRVQPVLDAFQGFLWSGSELRWEAAINERGADVSGAHQNRQVRVDDVCEVEVVGRVVGFVRNAEIEEPDSL